MRTPRSSLHLLILVFVACSGGGGSCSGCGGCLTPLPNGFTGTRLNGAVTARVTQDGFTFINSNWAALLPGLGVTNPIAVPVACSNVSFGSGGHLCDQNRNNSCDPGEQCNVTVTLVKVKIDPATAPTNQGLLKASAELEIKTGDMWMRTCAASLFGACICRLTCSANFDSTRSGQQIDDFSAEVVFTLDTQFGNLLAFDVANINGINTLESGDLSVNTSGFCSALACSLLNVGFIKSFVVDQFVKPALQTQLRSAVDDARCRSCGPTTPACPGGSTCQGGKCRTSTRCVPTLLGLEGRLDLGAALASLNSEGGGMELLVAAGGAVSSQVQDHLTLGVVGGAKAQQVDSCVPPAAPLPAPNIGPPDFAAGPASYHVGVAIAGRFLDETGYAAHQAGGLCLRATAREIPFLSTGTLGALLPSLGMLATVDGKDAPMMMVVRPSTPPRFTIGAGTFDPITKLPKDPLITMALDDLAIDFYAQLDERQVRVFTLEADVALPLSLIPEGCDRLVPAMGDPSGLITVTAITNSEVIAEDPNIIKLLLPLALQLAGPSLANGLGGFALPTLGGFKLQVREVKGITPLSGGGFQHIGIFAGLLNPNAMCATAVWIPRPEVIRQVVPSPRQWREAKGELRASLFLKVGAADLPPDAELSYRINGGLWSPFQAPLSGELEVRGPQLLLQGRHRVEVRGRSAGAPWALTAIAGVDVEVDSEPPRLRLERGERGVRVVATDRVTVPGELEYAYRVGGQPLGGFGPSRELTPLEVEQGFEVQVRDRAGNLAHFRQPPLAQPLREASQPQPPMGCSATAGGPLALLLLLLGRAARRASRP